MTEAHGERHAGDPNHNADRESRYGMPETGPNRCARGLKGSPLLLAGDNGDWNPVVGYQRVQNTDGKNRADKQPRRVPAPSSSNGSAKTQP